MGIIKILDENLSNMIAAGEVVENPASLIKELLENSLDAESTYIKISVKNGGKTISIIDNGKGMSKEDLLLCIERHATSKISSKDDLFNLSTYGFRGEALSSIAAVSKMIISSKREKDDIGHSINVLGGKITNLKTIQKSRGTEIEIKDLFFNTPARLKFLRKDSTENNKIKEIVTQEALANPNISITLSIDGKEVLRTSGKGMENTIIDIFNISILKNLKSFKYGYVGNLSLTRSSKDFIFIFVNGRPVKAKIIEEALMEAYYTKLMKGKYPFAIINYNIDPKNVDVNVHPSKKIVKFSNDREIYDTLFKEISNSLEFDKDFSSSYYKTKEENSFQNFLDKNEVGEQQNLILNDLKSVNKEEKIKFLEDNNQESFKEDFFTLDEILSSPSNEIGVKLEEKIETKLDTPELQPNKTKIETQNKKDFKVLGQFSNSFILVEENKELVIYDQHIVHERILYEKLKKQYYNKKIVSQKLLVPIKLSLTSNEMELFKEKYQYFNDFGFEIDEFNLNELLLRAVPSIPLKDSFENIFFNILNGLKKINSKNEVVENMIISMSCKGAIKINEKLSLHEMEMLINELHEIGNFTCPHGRPITFKITLLEIEKGFKRK